MWGWRGTCLMVPYPSTYYTSFLSLSGCQHTIRLAINWLDYVIKNSSGIYESNHYGNWLRFTFPNDLCICLLTYKGKPCQKMSPPTGRGISREGCRRVLPLRRLIWYHWRKNTTERETLSFLLTCGEAMPSLRQRGSTRLALAQADMKPTN